MLLGQQALVLCCLLNAASPRSGFVSTLGPWSSLWPQSYSSRKKRRHPGLFWPFLGILLVFGNSAYEISRDLSLLSVHCGRRWLGQDEDSLNCQQGMRPSKVL